MSAPARPALRWYGSKWRVAPWIISHFPPHRAYCEPYGGSAAVLLRKPPAKIETWNDLHGRAVNFFRMLRAHPQDLARLVDRTPYAREEYEASREAAAAPLEDARRFFVLSWQGRTGSTGGQNLAGWRYERDPDNRTGGPVAHEWASMRHLQDLADRLRSVQIERSPALEALARFDGPQVLHYVDPPYLPSLRSERLVYLHEMSEGDHCALAEVLHRVSGMVALSGYPSDLYDDLYGSWERFERATIADSAKVVTEVLWLNPAATVAAHQQTLFGGAGT
jgi:DNA adenine methylase